MIEIITFLQIIASLSLNQCSYQFDCSTLKGCSINNFDEVIEIEKTRSDHDYEYSYYREANIFNRLSTEYSDYTWSSSTFRKTNLVSNGNPVNVGGNEFPQWNVESGLSQSTSGSSYGGCGPIALIGVLDYFGRYLGYNEIIADTSSSSDRILLAKEVFNTTNTYEVGFGDDQGTLSFPWDLRDSFNTIISNHNLSGVISATCIWTPIPGFKDNFLNRIISNVNAGIPTTLMVAFSSVVGRPCDEHCTNVYGYRSFVGQNTSTNETIEKTFLIVRVNWEGEDYEYYCDADVLNQAFVSLVEYQINYNYDFPAIAVDFANDFVNSQGNGQYFYYNIPATIYLDENTRFNTNRLRCSYIENQYVVMSPKRENAGTSYLEFGTFSATQRFTFSAALWGINEDHAHEEFYIEYYKDNQWNPHITIDLFKLSKNKDNLDTFVVLFPKNTHQFRLIATHSNPSGQNNRGRIVLDNFNFEYNII